MKQKPLSQPKRQAATQPQAAAKKPVRPQLTLGRKNYGIMAGGLAVIIAGFITLAGGSTTLAPLLLVLGYCVIIPVGLLVR